MNPDIGPAGRDRRNTTGKDMVSRSRTGRAVERFVPDAVVT